MDIDCPSVLYITEVSRAETTAYRSLIPHRRKSMIRRISQLKHVPDFSKNDKTFWHYLICMAYVLNVFITLWKGIVEILKIYTKFSSIF